MVSPVEKIWLDGEFINWQDATVHILTHTLHYGLGTFEGMRCYKRKDGRSHIFRLTDHIERLYDSAKILTLEIPFEKQEIIEACKEIVRLNKLTQAYIRPLVFLGDGEMGLQATTNKVRLAIISYAWGEYLGDGAIAKGIRAKVSSYQRLHAGINPTKAKAVGNYVNSILANREIKYAGYDEAILLDIYGNVAEASGENIFIIRHGKIKTPPLGTTILRGLTRDAVISLAQDNNFPLIEQDFPRDELYIADEIFFTGTAVEITPVCEVDNRKIGTGKPGPVTKELQNIFFNVLTGTNTKYSEWIEFI